MMAQKDDYGLLASGLPPEIAAQARGLTRQQAIAEALAAQSQKPLETNRMAGGYVIPISPFEGIAKLVQAYVGAKGLKDTDKKFAELGGQYQKGLSEAISNYQKTRSGDPGRAPMMDPQEAEQMADQGTPAPPNVGATPGDPRKAIEQALMSPYLRGNPMVAEDMKSMRPVALGRSMVIPATGETVATDQTWQAEQQAAREAREAAAKAAQEQRMEELKMKLAEGRLTATERIEAQREIAQMNADLRREIAAGNIAGRQDAIRLAASLRPPSAADRPPAARPMSATAQKELLAAEEKIQGTTEAVGALRQAMGLNDKAMGFAGAGAVATAGTWLPERMRPATVDATNELDNLVVGSALPRLKTLFGGNPTEGERKVLVDLQGASGKNPAVRKGILERAVKAAEARIEFDREKVRRLREGTYFSNDGGAGAPPPAPSPAGLPDMSAIDAEIARRRGAR